MSSISLDEAWVISEYKASIALRDKHASKSTDIERVRALVQEGRLTVLRDIWLTHQGTDLHRVSREGAREKYLDFDHWNEANPA